jgi:hypothetical protein
MSKSKFTSNELVELTLEDGSKVKAKAVLSFEEFQAFLVANNFGENPLAGAPTLLKIALKDWDFEENGVKVPCNEENIDRLSGLLMIQISNLIGALYTPEKKS